MRNMTPANLEKVCDGRLYLPVDGDWRIEEKEATAVVLDSRLIVPGGIFIATRGERVDGHDFIPQVFKRGALAVICEELPQVLLGPCILVKDSFQALKDAAEFYRRQLDIKVIGITGSVGKTSTKEFIAGVLSARFKVWKTQGNYNNEVGLPLTVLQLREEHRIAVLEMGINQFGEMHRLSKIARPDICVLTNIGQCHLEFLKDRDGVLRAKSEILDYWNPGGVVCINGDDDKLITLKKNLGNKLVTFGRSPENDYYVTREESRGLLGSQIDLAGRLVIKKADISLPGDHMVLNALAATAVADAMGLTPEEIKRGMGLVEAVAGRSHIVRLKEYILIDDCYNANPVSMKSALDLLQEAAGRRVAILGDMFELGEEEVVMHSRAGSYAAGKCDLLFCVGRLSRAMYEGALESVMKDKEDEISGAEQQEVEILYMKQLEELYPLLREKLLSGDTILLKASHGMGFSQIVEWMKKNLA